MSSLLARVWNQQLLKYCPHTSVSGETWSIVRYGVTTGAGASDGTTVVDTGLTGSDYSGRYWVEFVESSTLRGTMKRIISDNGSGTLTLENAGINSQVGSGEEFRILSCPDPVIVVDSSSGATNVVDAVRAEADDFWNGYYIEAISGAQRGRIGRITDFVSSTGTFTVAAASGGLGFTAALSAGDVCLVRKYVEAGSVAPGVTQEYVNRIQKRVNFSMADGDTGPKGGSLSFNTRIHPSGSLSASGSPAGRASISGLFQATGMLESLGTSATVGAGSTTTAVTVATGSWENFRVGQMVVYDGNAAFITAIADGGGGVDTLTVSPALPVAPAAADTLYGTAMYYKDTTADSLGVLVEWEVDGLRHTMTGCKGSVTLNDAVAPEFAWSFQVDQWVREVEAMAANPGDAYATSRPVLAQDRLAYLAGTGVNINGLTATIGTEVAPKSVQGSIGMNGRAGYQIINYEPGATWRELYDASGAALDQDERWQRRTSKDLMVVFGSGATTFAVRLPAARMIQVPNPEDQGGLAAAPSVCAAHDAGVNADPDNTIVKVPDFAFFLS